MQYRNGGDHGAENYELEWVGNVSGIRESRRIVGDYILTEQDILANYPQISENKIHVIYNSVVLANFSICPNSQIPSKYILYVNTLHPYKNPLTLLKAFCKIRNQVKESLLFVGKETSHWNDVLLPFIKQEGIQDRVHRIENISNEELRWVYEHASLFVTSSLCEGFGYTPIEAAMCKCPVICSIQEALPDSTQGLLHYYQPAMDSDALAEEIIDVLLKNRPTIESLQYIAKVYSDYYSLEKQKGLIVNLLYCH